METTNDHLMAMLVEFKRENSEQHETMCENQRVTNGRVKKMEIWRSFIIGGISVLTAIVVPTFLMVVAKIIEKI